MEEDRRKKLTLATMCVATFVAILDTTVVNLALHTIQDKLHAGITVLQWVLDLYNLTYASFIMTGGILGDLFGRRRIFIAGMSLFTLGSLVCGLAPNSSILIAGRGVAGIGAALQLPGSLSILNVTFQDERERARAIAIWGGFNGLAMAVGPTVGGLWIGLAGEASSFWLFHSESPSLRWRWRESPSLPIRREGSWILRGKPLPFCFSDGWLLGLFRDLLSPGHHPGSLARSASRRRASWPSLRLSVENPERLCLSMYSTTVRFRQPLSMPR